MAGDRICPYQFICKNNRKSNKIMQCVENFFMIGTFKDKAIFHVILDINRLPLFFFVNTVHNLVIFSIVFTKKKFSCGCFTIFSLETIYLSPELREKWPYL